MNMLLLTSIGAILILLLWVFSSGGDKTKEQLPQNTNDNNNNDIRNNDETTEEILSSPSKNTKPHIEDKEDREKIIPDSDFNLPYRHNNVIDEDSPFSIYKKTLENAEQYIKRGDFDSARDLYEGLKNRISDREITDRIDDNLEYMDNYKQIASKKKEQQIEHEQTFPSNEIKLSMSGPDSLPDRIQIGITPQKDKPELDLDEIVNRLSSKIEEKQLLNPQNFQQQKELDNYKQALDELKNEVNELNSVKKQLEDERNKRIQEDIEELKSLKEQLNNPEKDYENEITSLQNEIESLKGSSDNEEEIKKLRNEIDKLHSEKDDLLKSAVQNTEITNKENDELKVQITSLQQDLNDLLKDKNKSNELEKQIQEMAKNQNFEGNSDEIDNLKQEISDLKEILEDNKSKELEKAPAPSYDKSNYNEETDILNKMEREIEDKDEDYDLLEDYINGPKYNEPTEEEIMEKILNDAVKENQGKKPKTSQEAKKESNEEDYEIKAPDNSNQDFSNFDINKLFESRNPKDDFEEEFYSKFVDRNSQKKKKELPILNVTYNFEKLPDTSTLSREQNVLESSFYKFKPMIEKANDLLKRRKVKDAMNYYEVILNQEIPDQFKKMIQQNIKDLTDYLEKYMMN